MDIFSDITQGFVDVLSPFSAAPIAAIFILVVSLSMTLMSVWATNKFTDSEKLKADMEEVKEWREKFNEARSTGDPQLLQEVTDSQSRMMSLQGSMMTARCKPMLIYYIPFILIFGLLNALYVPGGAQTVVAVLPFNAQNSIFAFIEGFMGVDVPGSGFGLWFFPWYLLCSMGLGNLIRKASGISMM
ncbi:MAG: EMC3/TMCO1 family protein [Candidatus Thorarchaeota archaeon]